MVKKSGARSKFSLLEHSTQRTCDLAGTSSVGREATDIVFPTLSSLSRKHFKIIIDDEGAWIEDLGSSNGTKLNKVKLQPHVRVPLLSGDLILAGKANFTFHIRPTLKKEAEAALGLEGAPAPAPMLAPEISLVGLKRQTFAKPSVSSNKMYSDAVAAPETLHKSSKTKKKKRRKKSGTQYWSVVLLALVFSALTCLELDQIRSSPYVVPHPPKDMILRFFFSTVLTYVCIVAMQFVFTLTFARRWYTATLTMGLAIFIGSMVGERLDLYAEYQKAGIENKLAAQKTKNARRPATPDDDHQ